MRRQCLYTPCGRDYFICLGFLLPIWALNSRWGCLSLSHSS
uniref:Uncharacterized protein n=1 Tax=Rhizophora mucronata TaxID=61149 RepID=A0A2P2QL03_RHIMU